VSQAQTPPELHTEVCSSSFFHLLLLVELLIDAFDLDESKASVKKLQIQSLIR
jgi:hypothetical protein